MSFFGQTFTSASTSNVESKPLDIQAMVDAINRVPPCPVAEYMRSKGADPAKGWVLMLPPSYAASMGPFTPKYVVVNPSIKVPLMLRNPMYKHLEYLQRADKENVNET